MDRFASFDGTTIAYLDSGAGPDVLLLHGFAADHQLNWVAPGVVDALVTAGRRVIALDARGHGQSDKPHDQSAYEDDAMARDARALLDHLGVERVDVVGYSMGSLVSTRLVPDEPRARSCVLGGIGGRARGPRGFSDERRALLAAALETEDIDGIADPSARAFRTFADSTGADRLALAAIQRAATPTAKTRLDRINVPTMVIAGDKDDLAGSPQDLADRIPGATARLIKGTHLGAVADPAFPAAIVEFVTNIPAT
ncbi:MAG: alpha/beta fold hydrolase [Acidimicrobiia bacterium]